MKRLSHAESYLRSMLRGRPLIGRLLLAGGFISRSELDRALARQRTTNEQLGQILVRLGKLEPAVLAAVLSLQESLADPGAGARLAAGIRQRLGDLLLRASRITRAQLDEALEEQQRTGVKLGDILVRRGVLERDELERALDFQRCQAGEQHGDERLRLGEILVATGQISREQLDEALKRQRRSGNKLGEELLAAGFLKARQLEHALSLQQKLVTAALAAVLSVGALSAPQALGAEARRAFSTMQVSAIVLPFARARPMQQTSSLRITEADVARGYVDVPAGTALELETNSRQGVIFAFYNMARFVKSIKIGGLGGDVELGPSGGEVVERQAGSVLAGRALTLSYRFELGAGARPGTYAWPLLVSVRPL